MKKIKWPLYSVIFHIILIFGIFVHFQHALIMQTKTDTRTVYNKIVKSYLYTSTTPSVISHATTRVTQAKAGIHSVTRTHFTSVNSGTLKNQLLALLNKSIAASQSYPPEAIALNQTGTTSLRFRLYPDGHIETLQILHSSGTQSLDTAAKQSILAITPFVLARNYLNAPDTFSIDIKFES